MRHLVAAALLIALIAAAYGASIGHEFVFDDHVLVERNQLVRAPLGSIFERTLAPSAHEISYRPLRMLSYMVDYRIAGGLDPAVFHASNILYHAIAVLALYGFALAGLGGSAAPSGDPDAHLERRGPSAPRLPQGGSRASGSDEMRLGMRPFEIGAFAAAALFAVHPLGSEAVAYVAGRRDLLCAIGFVLSVWTWWAAVVTVRRPRALRALAALGAVLFALAGLAAKETALLIPALWTLVLPWAPAGWLRAGSRRLALALLAALPLALAAAVLYGERFSAAWSRLQAGALAPQPALSLRVLGQYLRLAFVPIGLSADYRAYAFPLPVGSLDATALAVAAVLVGIVVLGIALLLRRSFAGFGLLWLVLTLLPVAQIVPYEEVVSEHNAYVPLVGLAIAFGAAVASAAMRLRVALSVAILLLLLLTLLTHRRVEAWRDDLTLWSVTVEAAPRSVRGRYNLGIALAERGRIGEGQAELERAHDLAPEDRDVLLALASLRGRMGDYAGANDAAQRALRLQRDADGLTALGRARLGMGDAVGAIAAFDEALALDADAEEAHGLRERASQRLQRRSATSSRAAGFGASVPTRRQGAGDDAGSEGRRSGAEGSR